MGTREGGGDARADTAQAGGSEGDAEATPDRKGNTVVFSDTRGVRLREGASDGGRAFAPAALNARGGQAAAAESSVGLCARTLLRYGREWALLELRDAERDARSPGGGPSACVV